jgi:hypothetical protein
MYPKSGHIPEHFISSEPLIVYAAEKHRMSKLLYVPRIVLRAAIWKTTPQACGAGPVSVIGWAGLTFAIGAIYEYWLAAGAARFIP